MTKQHQKAAGMETMTDANAERRRRALKRVAKGLNLNWAEWARRAAVKPNSLYNFLNGRSASLNAATYERLAAAANVPVETLMGQSPRPVATNVQTVPVVGEVQAGVWREALMADPADRYDIQIPSIAGYANRAFGLIVRGDSMDREYPPGTVLVCVDLHDFDGELNDGGQRDHVVVERVSRDGLVEATVKELDIRHDGRAWLWPRSSNPEHQQPIPVPWPYDGGADAETGAEHICIRAVVIGSYRPRR